MATTRNEYRFQSHGEKIRARKRRKAAGFVGPMRMYGSNARLKGGWKPHQNEGECRRRRMNRGALA